MRSIDHVFYRLSVGQKWTPSYTLEPTGLVQLQLPENVVTAVLCLSPTDPDVSDGSLKKCYLAERDKASKLLLKIVSLLFGSVSSTSLFY